MLKFKNQDAYEARFRALQIVDERAAVKSVNGVLPDDAGAITLTPADINAVSVEDVANIRGTFRINVTSSDGVYSADKTFDEIKAAYDAGQLPYVVYTSLTSNFVYALADVYLPTDGSGQGFMSFERYSIFDDTLETVSLRIFSRTLENGSNIEKQISPYNGQGVVGIQSVVQTVISNSDGGTNVITVTKTDGTSSTFTVKNGSKGSTGATGAAGEDGYTPVRGTDYWTADDIAAIQSYIDEKAAALQSKSITDSGGHFTTDTVEGALQEIGAELAGINTLLGSGIQISFTIDDGGSNSETFSVVSGTTWAEWIGTGRLIFNDSLVLYIYGGVVATEAGVYAVSLDGSTAVSGSDEIVSGATYTIINWGG